MAKISIKEESKLQSECFSVSISFDGSNETDNLTVCNPLTPRDRQKLEWHFEQFVNYPYLNTVEPSEAAKIIKEAGENLFKQLFSDSKIYNRYHQMIQEGIENLVIEISGSPEFHSLHWEALKDPDRPKAFALSAPILRKDKRPQNFAADVREASTINLLIVTSRPGGRRDVGYRTISRPLIELLRSSKLPVKVHILRPATYESLDKHLDSVGKGFYHVVHFDVHGALLTFGDFEKIENEKTANALTYQLPRYGRPSIDPYTGKDAFLFLDLYRESETADDDGFRADPVRADELANLLLDHGVPIVILNACQSAKELSEQEKEGVLPIAEETSLASRLMRAGAQMVLAMSYSVTVTAAEILMENLYNEIFNGKDIPQAIKIGRDALFNHKFRRALFNFEISLEDWLLPVVYQTRDIRLKTKTLTPQEEEELFNARAEIGDMPNVEYGFHGRDIDILNIERRVLLKNNILMIRGMGGAGKTTLLQHLAWWWRVTGFIEKVFYFGYDEKAYTRQEIIFKIAESLYDRFEFPTFQAMNEMAQIQKLAHKLRTERHLLILDNLESIQGGYFAVKNTLSAEEQSKLKDFLSELRGKSDSFQSQTIVLLGSRSEEEWLADNTFGENLYDLGGLDRESATQFAEEILRQKGISHYKTNEDFKKLLKLLAGFPLSLKVIFENLKYQSPTQILDALKAGGVNLNTGTAEEKTADILKCIEYSHSNIAPEKQELLLCLAPFTSVVSRVYFSEYIEELKKHDALNHLQHELWDEVFTESVERGLMSQQEEIPIFYLQPILPYFLKTEWQNTKSDKFKQSVQTAFRNYFENISGLIWQLMASTEANKHLLGRDLISIEFENIETCLDYSLSIQTFILNPYVSLSVYYDSIQNNQAGLNLGRKVLNRMKSYPEKFLSGEIGLDLAQVLDDIAKRQYFLGMYDESESTCQEMIELYLTNESLKSEEKKGNIARVYHELGLIIEEKGNWEKAEEYYQQALQIFIDLNEEIRQAEILDNLGIEALNRNQWEKAETYFQQAIGIYIKYKVHIKKAGILMSLGQVMIGKQLFDKATIYLQQALLIFSEFNEVLWQARVLYFFGRIEYRQGNNNNAVDYFQKSLRIFIEFNDRHWQSKTFYKLGDVLRTVREFGKAEGYYLQALELSLECGELYTSVNSFIALGLIKLEQETLIESQAYFLQALKTARDFNYQRGLEEVLRNLNMMWKKIGNNEFLLKVSNILVVSEAEAQEIIDRFSGENRSGNES